MKSIDLRWRPGTARFEARGDSGAWMTLAAPDEPDGTPLDEGPHGGAAGPGPAELLLVAGAGCAAWDVVEILRKQRQDVTGIDCHVDGEQQPDAPWTFRRVVLAFTVRGRGLDPAGVSRAVDLAVEKYCAVLSTVAHAATIEHTAAVEDESALA
ncbi:MAG TPA: OsmC family protein [Candidatus Nanopelagicales bacterium]|nr:OsmC family protein [Candidatus Nanopelagicales bacterium]